MKRLVSLGLLMIMFGLIYNYREDIMKYTVNTINKNYKNTELTYSNEYTRKKDYNYVKITKNFNVTNKNQFLDIYYTIVDSGIDEFTFYCDKKYTTCTDDVSTFAEDQKTLSNINSFVHPYNSFTRIKTEVDSLNRIKVKVEKAYTKEQITTLNDTIGQILETNLRNITDQRELIKAIHNYIINKAKYDIDRSDKNIKKYSSTIAYGPLIEGYSLCGGYTDAMAIFLDLYNIPNFKVISENHIWNAVYINNKWLHLDLTWDDPVSKDGRNILDYTFFLISTNQLEKLETNQHQFDKNVFSEIK